MLFLCQLFQFFRQSFPALHFGIKLSLCVCIFSYKCHVRRILWVAKQCIEFFQPIFHLGYFPLALFHSPLGLPYFLLLLLMVSIRNFGGRNRLR